MASLRLVSLLGAGTREKQEGNEEDPSARPTLLCRHGEPPRKSRLVSYEPTQDQPSVSTPRVTRLVYHVEMTLPAAALEVRAGLVEASHRSARGIGVITGRRERSLYLAVLTYADDEDAARSRALRLVIAAIDEHGLGELAPHIELGEITSHPAVPGGAHRVEAAPAPPHRSATLPDGRVVRAACTEPLGEWFAYVQDDPARVMAGRALPRDANAVGLPSML